MDQTKVMKRRMVTAIILFSITFVAMLIFIGLYIDASRRVQETFRKQYSVSLEHTVEAIDAYLDGEGDHDMRYTRIISEMSCANSYAFLIKNFTSEQKTANEVYSALIKFPDQMKGNLEDLRGALKNMSKDLDKGYKKADEIIESLDLKGK
ncbi:MAG: hypothetical protein IJ129_00890 [Ruminococcus sp.]|nr:hypothetical protein [Ruminococcus sp.]